MPKAIAPRVAQINIKMSAIQKPQANSAVSGITWIESLNMIESKNRIERQNTRS